MRFLIFVLALVTSLSFAVTKTLTPLVKELLSAKQVTLVHTTREVAPEIKEKATIPSFDPFPAGRYAVTFTGEKGVKHLILQTENKVGHFHPVIPGQTKIDGYVALTDDPMSMKEKSKLPEKDVLKLFKGLRHNWGRIEEIKDADKKTILLALAAIYSNGDRSKLLKALDFERPAE